MTEGSAEARLLRGMVQFVMDAELTPDETRAVARALRNPEFFAPVSNLLDVIASISDQKGEPLASSQTQQQRLDDKQVSNRIPRVGLQRNDKTSVPSVLEMFDTVKRRKVTKSQLFSMMDAISASGAPELESEVSIRESLELFRAATSDREWQSLREMVEGKATIDPFLKRILRHQ